MPFSDCIFLSHGIEEKKGVGCKKGGCYQLVIILTVNILYANFLVLPGFDFCKQSRTVILARMHTGSYPGHITDRKKNKLEKRQLLILSKLITPLK
jgi:hypothetical protein